MNVFRLGMRGWVSGRVIPCGARSGGSDAGSRTLFASRDLFPAGRTVAASALLFLLSVVSFSAALGGDEAINIVDYGARPEKNFDSTEAITKALAAAKEAGRVVYIPEGTWEYRKLTIDSVRLKGAGSDKTTLFAPDPKKQMIVLKGDKPAIENIRVSTVPTRRDSENDAVQANDADGFEISHIEIDGANAAGIMIYAKNGRVTNNLVRNTKSDSIHVSNHSSDIYIAGNVVRNSGDDCIAVVSYQVQKEMCRNIMIENNDVADQYWGRGITVVGGENVTIRNNRVANTSGAGIYIASESSYQTFGVDNVLVQGNTVVNCPGLYRLFPDFLQGGIEVFSSTELPVQNVLIENNKVENSPSNPVRIHGLVKSIFVRNNSFPAPESAESEGGNVTGSTISSSILGGAPVALPQIPNGFGLPVQEVVVKLKNDALSGKSLKESKITAGGAYIRGIWRGNSWIAGPESTREEMTLESGDRLLLVGTSPNVDKARKMVEDGE